jgi:predicted ATPase
MYKSKLDLGELKPDARQVSLAKRYQTLYDNLLASRADNGSAPKGLYIYGGVGCGKTMMMDMFHDAILAQGVLSSRTHFHTFMLDVHQTLHDLTQAHKKAGTEKGDLLPQVAAGIAKHARVLCFDEFQVTDVADAFLLQRLLTELLKLNCVLVTTSNRAPDQLYENGLNRALFLPCIAMLKASNNVVDMAKEGDIAGHTDYRRLTQAVDGNWISPLGPATETRMLEIFKQCCADSKTSYSGTSNKTVPVRFGRKLTVRRQSDDGKVCMIAFSELCQANLGASDYIALGGRFHTVYSHRPLYLFKSAITVITLTGSADGYSDDGPSAS